MFAAAICLTILCISCSPSYAPPPEFDGGRAFDYLQHQVEFGPRVPGSEASAECRQFCYRHFQQLGLAVDSQAFIYFDRYSQQNIRMVNVIASYKSEEPSGENGIILMAHYDCRPRTDHASDTLLLDEPIDGANDGASGVAVLMEIANLMAAQQPPLAVDLVLVDGEDWGMVGDHAAYTIGSREYARLGVHDKYRFGIIVDLVGDQDQQIYREGYSERYAKDLNDMVWGVAARLGIETFVDSVRHTVIDDHLSLSLSGVPSICIIDLDYEYWHTEFDTPDKCSSQSLANVGRVVTEIVYNPSLWPKKR
ncbi:MAG: M28 family peptidase [Candidatus Zixiibacteriota bacterium]|nr:MAG: M28 family peptidase [candidate division Zixibacteria bacterium]